MESERKGVVDCFLCDRPRRKREWCTVHYQRWLKWGDPNVVKKRSVWNTLEELRDFLMENYDVDSKGCWNWRGSKDMGGYGTLRATRLFGKKTLKTNRLVAYFFHGLSMVSKKLALHRCDNPSCINPSHIFIGSYLDNNRDRMLKGRNGDISCDKNVKHKLTPEDVWHIRELLNIGVKHGHIAEDFGVCRGTITAINNNRSWRCLK